MAIDPDLAQLQRELFDRIAGLYPSRSAMIEALSELLGCERGAVYNRIAGKKFLSLPEYALLLRRFHLPDTLIHHLLPDQVLVQYPSLLGQPARFTDWLDPIVRELRQLAVIPDAHIWYAANELPFLHYFQRPLLAVFKYHVWNHFTWQDQHSELPILRLEDLRQLAGPWRPVFAELVTLHHRIATTEIWHTTLLNNTLSQIEFLAETGAMPDKTLKAALIEELLALLEDLESQAAIGHKGDAQAPFRLYHNEIVHTNNLALLRTPRWETVLFAYDNPNYMRSRNAALCAHTGRFFDKLIAHSSSLAGSSQKARARFFNTLRQRVARIA
jgi:hypothetical protein